MISKSLKKLGLIGLSTALLSGCVSYNIAGRFEDTGQTFIGNVMVGIGDVGTLEAQTTDGSVTCKGESRMTERPSAFAMTGGRGTGVAECSDGRVFKVDFLQTSEHGGHGIGLDNNNSVVKLYFDNSAKVAQSKMELDLLNSLTQ